MGKDGRNGRWGLQPRTPALPAWFPDVRKQLAAQYDSVLKALVPQVKIVTPQIQMARRISRMASELLDQYLPVNLRHLAISEMDRIVEVSQSDAISLAWAPRTEVIEDLLQSVDAQARGTLFDERIPVMLADVDDSLQQVKHQEYAELAAFARTAITVFDAGYPEAALALATNVLDTALGKHVPPALGFDLNLERGKARDGGWWSSDVRAQFKASEDDDEQTLDEFRRRLVGCGLTTAFAPYDWAARSVEFNRNGVAHAVSPELYRASNAVRALLLANALLRWVDVERLD